MKPTIFLTLMAIIWGYTVSFADIHQPPSADYGPTRKLGRAINNMALGSIDVLAVMSNTNYLEGNSEASTYGAIKGLGRALARLGLGVYEFLLFPIPTNKGTYYPPYRLSVPWTLSGFDEFPPELGFETRYNYSRLYPMTPW
ncbi:MAG: exosortase system-associated protein, TIGR04073 family [Chthoniobacterales bacterium]|nr:exosortase system-associated protein, TIGR04073 family [Chthoniobacterales bacterium]